MNFSGDYLSKNLELLTPIPWKDSPYGPDTKIMLFSFVSIPGMLFFLVDDGKDFSMPDTFIAWLVTRCMTVDGFNPDSTKILTKLIQNPAY